MDETREIIQTAIKMEVDGITFYREAAEKTSNQFGKKMFLSLSRDEERHLDVLKRVLEDLDFADIGNYFDASPRERVKTIWDQSREDLEKRLAAQPDELEALKLGLRIEDGSVTFYQKALGDLQQQTLRELLQRLIQEEREHYSILQNTYNALQQTGDWYLWEERGLLDGGEL